MSAAAPVRLLIVDDEVPQMRALCDTLAEAGYLTRGFDSGVEAVETLRREPFDLLLTDLMMPRIDGITLMRACQEIDRDLACIVMTGHGTIATAVDALKTGASDYVLKPFKVNGLLPVLERALTMRRLKLENRELEQRVRERTRELEVANKDLESFAYSVSHDLREPLRAVEGFCEMFRSEFAAQVPEPGQRILERIWSGARRMTQLIDDLLHFSRCSREPLSRARVSLAALAQEVSARLREQLGERQLTVEIGELPDCFGDRALLEQVLVNLLSNAFKFTARSAAARVEVGALRQGQETVYYVRDNGVGFDMRYAERLFGVFQRLHKQEDFAGTGIGLSIVHRIVTRHGGRVWADSRLGEGTTLYFTLPGEAQRCAA
jgi:two-component system, sensor histidine kinase and response regulator